MANHASADKRFRQSEKRRVHNKYYARTTRNAIKAIRNTTDKAAAEASMPKVFAMIDKLAKIDVNEELTSSCQPGFCRGQQEVSKRWKTAVQRS